MISFRPSAPMRRVLRRTLLFLGTPVLLTACPLGPEVPPRLLVLGDVREEAGNPVEGARVDLALLQTVDTPSGPCLSGHEPEDDRRVSDDHRAWSSADGSFEEVVTLVGGVDGLYCLRAIAVAEGGDGERRGVLMEPVTLRSGSLTRRVRTRIRIELQLP